MSELRLEAPGIVEEQNVKMQKRRSERQAQPLNRLGLTWATDWTKLLPKPNVQHYIFLVLRASPVDFKYCPIKNPKWK